MNGNDFKRPLRASEVYVQNADGKIISIAYANRAMKTVYRNKAVIVSENPLTIRLLKQVEVEHEKK